MNYIDTFIEVAADTTVTTGTAPPSRGGNPTIAQLEYALIAGQPHTYTQEAVLFAVHAQREAIPAAELAQRHDELWQAFFAKPQACMRASPLPKFYGWGLHFDSDGKVALVPMDSADYTRLASDPTLAHTRAIRSRRG